MMQQIKLIGLVLFLGFGLIGCTAHPGAGTWGAVAMGQAPFSKLLVHFEGRAELIDATTGTERYHCFWGGKSATEIQLDCTTPEDTETRIHFNLQVGENGQAQLLRDGKPIGTYQRQSSDLASPSE